MKLYLQAGACSLSPHIVLEETGASYTTESVDLKTKQTETGEDFLAINPKGYVPALLLDDGELLTEGPAIVQYLADLHPEKALAPANGTRERYHLQSWLTFIGTELHKSCSAFFNPMAKDDWREAAMANISRRLDYLNEYLGANDYLLGGQYSVADAYLFTVLGWMKYIDVDLGKWAALTAYQGRIFERPAVQAALKAEGLI